MTPYRLSFWGGLNLTNCVLHRIRTICPFVPHHWTLIIVCGNISKVPLITDRLHTEETLLLLFVVNVSYLVPQRHNNKPTFKTLGESITVDLNLSVLRNYMLSIKDWSLDQVGKMEHHYVSTSNLTKNGPIFFWTNRQISTSSIDWFKKKIIRPIFS